MSHLTGILLEGLCILDVLCIQEVRVLPQKGDLNLFGSIEFHLVPFQTHFQVPNLLSLGFHLVCEDTHLSQEIKHRLRIRTGSPHTTDSGCEKNDRSFWRVAGGGNVLDEGNPGYFLTWPGSLSHHPDKVGHISGS